MPSERIDAALIQAVEEEIEIGDALRAHGLDEVASRLAQLRELLAEDPDELDMVLESLRSFADFFIQEERLTVPEVGAGPEGFLEAEWRIPIRGEKAFSPDSPYWGRGDGVLAMKFLPSGLVQFAATSGPAGQGIERLRTSGTLPKSSIMSAVQTFVSG